MLCFSTFKAANIIIYASQSNLKNINHIANSKSLYLLTIYLTDLYSHYIFNINKMVEILRNIEFHPFKFFL